MRLPMICNWNPETTVLAHVGKSHMGGKCSDLFAAFACSACHDVIDGRAKSHLMQDQIELYKYEAMERTQAIWLKEGLIKIEP
jgi:hypothetical protein